MNSKKFHGRHCCTNEPTDIVTYEGGGMEDDIVLVCSSCIDKHPWNKAIRIKKKIGDSN